MSAGGEGAGVGPSEIPVIREAAANWVVLWSAGEVSPAMEMEFFEWLRRSPAHVKEYLQAETAWLAMDGAARAHGHTAEEVAWDTDANVVPLLMGQRGAAVASDSVASVSEPGGRQGRDGQVDRDSKPARDRWRVAGIAASLVALAGVISVFWLTGRVDDRAYETEVGEQRRITLADGSAMEINTDSRIRVRFGKESRDIYLDEGEVFFDVAKDVRRPFRVFSDTSVIRAIGTQFNVYRQKGQTEVTVLEGRVAIGNAPHGVAELAGFQGAPSAPLEVPAGRKVIVEAASKSDAVAIPRDAVVDSSTAAAWRRRRLIFDDAPLADVVAEFNRYNVQHLAIEDPRLAAERISGVFDADKPRALVRFLAQQSGIVARPSADSRLILARP